MSESLICSNINTTTISKLYKQHVFMISGMSIPRFVSSKHVNQCVKSLDSQAAVSEQL